MTLLSMQIHWNINRLPGVIKQFGMWSVCLRDIPDFDDQLSTNLQVAPCSRHRDASDEPSAASLVSIMWLISWRRRNLLSALVAAQMHTCWSITQTLSLLDTRCGVILSIRVSLGARSTSRMCAYDALEFRRFPLDRYP